MAPAHRTVWYQIVWDPLGNFIRFKMDVRPEEMQDKLPNGTRIVQVEVECWFSGHPGLSGPALEALFLEFAKAIGWTTRAQK